MSEPWTPPMREPRDFAEVLAVASSEQLLGALMCGEREGAPPAELAALRAELEKRASERLAGMQAFGGAQ